MLSFWSAPPTQSLLCYKTQMSDAVKSKHIVPMVPYSDNAVAQACKILISLEDINVLQLTRAWE